MKLDDEYFESRKMFDPLPECIEDDEYHRQAKEYLARKRQRAGESIAEILEHASRQPRTAGRPKRDGRGTIIELNSSNPPTRKDRWLARSDARARMMVEMAIATRLQEYAAAGRLSKELLGHPKERKLWRIRKVFSNVNLSAEQVDPIIDWILEGGCLPSLEREK